jgi:hypothetical protein
VTGASNPLRQADPGPRAAAHDRSPDPASVLAGLDRLRAILHRGLDRIEALAIEAVGDRPGPDPDLEWRLGQIEEARARLQAEAERCEQTRREQLEQIDRDRRELAAAWERLECEQVKAHGSERTQPGAIPTVGLAPPTRTVAHHVSEDEGPVAQAVLRQFEALRRDVRRNAESQRPGAGNA